MQPVAAVGADVDARAVGDDVGAVGLDDVAVVPSGRNGKHHVVSGEGAEIADQRRDVVAGFEQHQAAPRSQLGGERGHAFGQFGVGELRRFGQYGGAVTVIAQVIDQRTHSVRITSPAWGAQFTSGRSGS